MPLVLRSAGVLFFSYAAFAGAGMPAAYLTALVAPAFGLLTGSSDWLVMLPIVLASNLLAMLGLEYGWRYAAIVISPAMLLAPLVLAMLLPRQELFTVHLPWDAQAMNWVLLHGLIGLLGVLLALYVDRVRRRHASAAAAREAA